MEKDKPCIRIQFFCYSVSNLNTSLLSLSTKVAPKFSKTYRPCPYTRLQMFPGFSVGRKRKKGERHKVRKRKEEWVGGGIKNSHLASTVTRIFLSTHQRTFDYRLHMDESHRSARVILSTWRWRSVDWWDGEIKAGDTWVLLVSVCFVMLCIHERLGGGQFRHMT